MPTLAFAIPGDLDAPTGGYGYDRRLLALLAGHGVEARHVALPGGFPSFDRGLHDASFAALARAPGDVLLIDGLAYGTFDAARVRALFRPVAALVHHPLALEDGLSPEAAERLERSERAALEAANAVIVTSPATARLLAERFAVPASKLTVAVCGTDAAPRATGSDNAALRLVAVGSVVPRKGYDVLLRALAGLPPGPDWTLRVVGSLDAAPDHAREMGRLAAELGLEGRVRFLGALAPDALDGEFGGADLFVMPSRFEGFGMALTEAVARGLPIVTTTGGALRETLPPGAGLAVPPGDVAALRRALADTLADAPLRRRLSDAAWAAAARLPRWNDAAARVAETVRVLAARDSVQAPKTPSEARAP